MVFQVSKSVKVPIIGMGGIMNAEDAVAFFLAGASAVATGTANFLDPLSPVRIIEGIQGYMTEHGMGSIHEVIGKLQGG
jgi:dihydroorotate dehydrogenase (NAD+) catalytic subunit